MGLLGALDAGGDTVLLTDQEGNVVEGPGFNVFAVSQGALVPYWAWHRDPRYSTPLRY